MRAMIDSQDGWTLKNSGTEVFVTENGGHMAPVKFYADSSSPIQPYYVSPWQNEGLKYLPDPVLIPLRGDFFCMPFGGNSDAVNGERHSCHGEPASSRWNFEGMADDNGVATLALAMASKVRPGRIKALIRIVEEQNVVYTSHLLEGYSGEMPLGHHATLAVPEEEGSLRVSVGKFDLGMTNPSIFSNPEEGNYQSFGICKKFKRLQKVPTLWKEAPYADASSFPRRKGFTDLLLILKKPSARPAWTAAFCRPGGYIWFSLKDPSVLPATAFWISNCGRHGSPWNGRNKCLGLEDVCGYFADGLAASTRRNVLNEAGFPTSIRLSPEKTSAIHYIQGAVRVSPDFGERVKNVKFGRDRLVFISDTGKTVETKVNYNFLKTGIVKK